MRIQKLIFLTILALVFSFTAQAMGRKNRPSLMGVLGDSIPSATFGDTGLSPLYLFPFSEQTIHTSEEVVTRLIGTRFIENKKSVSWASGQVIDSHFMRLRKILGQDRLDIYNVAFPASKTRHLEVQAEMLVGAMKLGIYEDLKYVTIMAGSNDACGRSSPEGTPDDQIAQDLYRAFKKLAEVQQKDPVHILISGIPRIPELGRKDLRDTVIVGKVTCEVLQQKVLRFCNRLIGWSTQLEYQQTLNIVDAKNRVIQEAAERASHEFGNLNIHYSGRLFGESISIDNLAVDCFHPNIKGHQAISDALWSEQPWFK